MIFAKLQKKAFISKSKSFLFLSFCLRVVFVIEFDLDSIKNKIVEIPQ